MGWPGAMLYAGAALLRRHFCGRPGVLGAAVRTARDAEPHGVQAGARGLAGRVGVARTILCWSGGKDSAWTLHELRQAGTEVAALLTTVNEANGRVAMHAIRGELLEAQAAAAGIPLGTVPLPGPCTNAAYEARLPAAFRRAARARVP